MEDREPIMLLETHEAAATLGCSVDTIRRHSRSGRLVPFARTGRARLYSRDQILAFDATRSRGLRISK